jgi:hypothetical protein
MRKRSLLWMFAALMPFCSSRHANSVDEGSPKLLTPAIVAGAPARSSAPFAPGRAVG